MDSLRNGKSDITLKELVCVGKSGGVCGETVDSWKEWLPEILNGYSKDDIYNFCWGGVSCVHPEMIPGSSEYPRNPGIHRQGG